MSIFRKIRALFSPYKIIRDVFHDENKIVTKSLQNAIALECKIDRLIHFAINSVTLGVCKEKTDGQELIVSITSYGKRVREAFLPIESIMQGSMKPNRIILWLPEEMKSEKLPIILLNQVKRGLEIKYCKDIFSYKKLIPALKEFPDAYVITIDDDVIYEYDFVETLWRTSRKHPNAIAANRIHQIIMKNGVPVPYNTWKQKIGNTEACSPLFFFTGIGGVLYPPRIFGPEIFDDSIFLSICRYSDDIWFNAMALKYSVPVYKTETRSAVGEDFIRLPDPLEPGLKEKNVYGETCLNDVQIKAVFEKYSLYSKLT